MTPIFDAEKQNLNAENAEEFKNAEGRRLIAEAAEIYSLLRSLRFSAHSAFQFSIDSTLGPKLSHE